MFDSLDKMREEIAKLHEDLAKMKSEKKDESGAPAGTPAEAPSEVVVNLNPFAEEAVANMQKASKKITSGCCGCLGLFAGAIVIAVLILAVICMKSCAKTENANQIKEISAVESGFRSVGALFVGDAAYSDIQTKADVEKILDSEGFCIDSKDGLLSSEGESVCLYFGFASEVRVAYDKNKRVRTVSSSSIIPGMQLISLITEYFFRDF